jgi:hypothetical protein
MMRLVLICLGCLPLLAHGATYKCVDAQGRVSYSQMPEPGKRCTEASLPPVQTIPSQAPTPKPESAIERGAPAESKGEQSKAGAQDLAEAKKALDDARKRLAEQEAVRYGDEKNYQRVLDRLKPYQDEVSRAEARVRELGGTP